MNIVDMRKSRNTIPGWSGEISWFRRHCSWEVVSSGCFIVDPFSGRGG